MRNQLPLRDTWEAFNRQRLPASALPAERRQELRIAYYSGAYAMFTLIAAIVALPEDRQGEVMARMQSELDVFNATAGTRIEGLL